MEATMNRGRSSRTRELSRSSENAKNRGSIANDGKMTCS
jgi:hypothetical protein